MSKMRKLIVFCAMALIMMVVAAPQALAQSYWDPAWLGTTSDPGNNSSNSGVVFGNDFGDNSFGGQGVSSFDSSSGDIDFG